MASIAEASSHNVRPEVFLRHFHEIRDTKTAHSETGMAVARAKKAAKNDGIDLDALKLMEQLAKFDPDEVDVLLRHLGIYSKWAEMPIGTQGNIFGAPEAPPVPPEAQSKHQEFVAGENGLAAGKSGALEGSNPYQPGSQQFVAWQKSWTKGNKLWIKNQNAIAKRMGRNAESGNGAAESTTH